MSEPVSEASRDLLRQLEADPGAATVPNQIVLQAWQTISRELLRLIDHMDEDVDPVVKTLSALVGGFHGIEPEVDTEMRDLFALGAQQRARVDQLEGQIGDLVSAVAEIKAAVQAPACAGCQGSAEPADLKGDNRERFRRQTQLRRISAAPVPQ
jgi:hypothetical protein